MSIQTRVAQLKAALPPHVEIVAAAKTRTPQEVLAAVQAGVHTIGHNYVQEAQAMIDQVGREAASWTFIGHLQRNKVKSAVALFDSIQTIDSLALAQAVNRACKQLGRVMPVLIEVNAAQEPQKAGALPEDVPDLVREIAQLEWLRVRGLMAMGPWLEDAEQLRPFFRQTRQLFDRLASAGIPGASMETLSMGMSDSYAVAIEEGSTMVRLGTALFGPRPQ